MRNIIIIMLAIIVLGGCSAREAAIKAEQYAIQAHAAVASVEGAVEALREQKDTAVKLGLPAESIERIDAALARAEVGLAQARAVADEATAAATAAREASENGGWLQVILAAVGVLLGGAGGVALLGPKAAMAAKAVHMARAVVAGVEALKSPETKPLIEETMRGLMTPGDKALVRELRTGQL